MAARQLPGSPGSSCSLPSAPGATHRPSAAASAVVSAFAGPGRPLTPPAPSSAGATRQIPANPSRNDAQAS
eukprot:2573382-Pyramimonas_sp.AAC.1